MLLAKEKYEKLQKIGEGTYGIVWKCKDSIGNLLAVKKIKLDNEDEGVPSTAMRQISILKELQPHPNIVSLREVDYQPSQKRLNLVFQYVDNDLRKHMKNLKHRLSNYQVKILMFQLLNGVNFCHSRRIIHRDLKPQNILISKDGIIKIADFGLARAFGLPIKTLTHQIETLWYRAPEVLLGQKQYSLGVDIWAIGCIFAELVEKKALFTGDCQIDQIFKIFQFFGTPTQIQWPNILKLPDFKGTFPKFRAARIEDVVPNMDRLGVDLLLKLIALDPARRISIKQALKHPYFGDLRQQQIARFII